MKLDEKRLVVEALLCAGEIAGPDNEATISWGMVETLDRFYGWDYPNERERIGSAAIDARRAASQNLTRPYSDACLCAAYRLIESSPTLRREWFERSES